MNLTHEKLLDLKDIAIDIVKNVANCDVPNLKFALSNSKNVAGLADYSKSTVFISQNVMKFHDENKCINTLVHEIFHFLAPKDGHRGKWLSLASRFNSNPDYVTRYGRIARTYKPTSEQVEARKYMIKCERCPKTITRNRMSDVVKYPSLFRCMCGGVFSRIK